MKSIVRQTGRLVGGVLCAGLLALAALAADTAIEPSLQVGAAGPSPAVAALIAQLSGDSWDAREAAQARLVEEGNKAPRPLIDACLAAYLSSDDPETASRLRNVLQAIVSKHIFTYQRKGFIGVVLSQHGPVIRLKDHLYRPVDIQRVLPDTAAMEGGLVAGQRILQVDEHRCIGEFRLPQFIEYIAGRNPGTEINLVLWSSQEIQTNKVILGERPPDPPLRLQRAEFFEHWLRASSRAAGAPQEAVAEPTM